MKISRRQFAQISGTALLAGRQVDGQTAALTAQQIVDRIQKNAEGPWQAGTLDGIKAGDPSAVVTGISTTAMATMDVLTRAVQQKANLVVTLEPVFFSRLDGLEQPAGAQGGGRGQTGVSPDDPVYLAKKDFIQKNGLIVLRFSDHWRTRKPDPFAAGLAKTMGWTQYQSGIDGLHYEIPPVALGALADDLAKRLKTRAGIRALGDPQSRVRRIALLPGVSALAATVKTLPESDLVVAGETREWESVEYAQDTVASGQKKGFIMLGRVVSQDPGMRVCADWLTKLVPEVPVRWLPAGDPYWRPA